MFSCKCHNCVIIDNRNSVKSPQEVIPCILTPSRPSEKPKVESFNKFKPQHNGDLHFGALLNNDAVFILVDINSLILT